MQHLSELRGGIIRLFEQGKSGYKIARLLKTPYSTVKKAIKRFRETGGNNDRPRSGRPRIARTPDNRQKIKARIKRNRSSRKNSTRKMGKALGISVIAITTVRL
jgi:transposase